MRLADEAAARFPSIMVRVIDLDHDGVLSPETVVAVQTYVLDGRVVALGNPDMAGCLNRLRSQIPS